LLSVVNPLPERCPPASTVKAVEHFQGKWNPVFGPEMRLNPADVKSPKGMIVCGQKRGVNGRRCRC
jgi:hypothetical protein